MNVNLSAGTSQKQQTRVILPYLAISVEIKTIQSDFGPLGCVILIGVVQISLPFNVYIYILISIHYNPAYPHYIPFVDGFPFIWALSPSIQRMKFASCPSISGWDRSTRTDFGGEQKEGQAAKHDMMDNYLIQFGYLHYINTFNIIKQFVIKCKNKTIIIYII